MVLPSKLAGAIAASSALILIGCQARSSPTPQPASRLITYKVTMGRLHRHVRSNGTVAAVNALTIRVPQIEGQGGNLTLTKIIASGTRVSTGDVLAEFDRTKQIDNAREAQAKFEDLEHQVEQRKAQHHADAEKRASDMQQARADLAKAQLELRKGPILSEIDRLKNQAKLDDAKAHVESLERSVRFHETSEAADLKILELQRDRQQVAWDRARSNADKLLLRAPIPGMVSPESTWRNDSIGPAQEGDQLWPGEPLVRIFDPTDMEVQVTVNEPDGAVLAPGEQATIHLDAYPGLVFQAHFDSASPVATALLGSDVKNFPARFRLDQSAQRDPHLLPDLSAAVDLDVLSQEPRLLVPRGAVHYVDGAPYVTRVSAAGRHEEKAVELGGFNDTWTEIAAGLAEGDMILAPPAPPAPHGDRG
jgi:multidrug efflux pump subunit AcrA (membrane-fusion protein)